MTTKTTAAPSVADLKQIAEAKQAIGDDIGAKRVEHNRTREDRVFSVAEAMARGDEKAAADLRAEIERDDKWAESSDKAGRIAQRVADLAWADYGNAALPAEVAAGQAFVERLEQLLPQVAQVAQQIVAARQRIRELHRLRCRPLAPHDEPPAPKLDMSPAAARMLAVITGSN